MRSMRRVSQVRGATKPRWTVNGSCRGLAVTAAGLLLAGAAVLAAAPAAVAATQVDCSTNNLQTAIDNAAPGATLIVSGTCPGNFTISKNLTLLGQGTAVLDGQQAGTTLTVSPSSAATVADLRKHGKQQHRGPQRRRNLFRRYGDAEQLYGDGQLARQLLPTGLPGRRFR